MILYLLKFWFFIYFKWKKKSLKRHYGFFPFNLCILMCVSVSVYVFIKVPLAEPIEKQAYKKKKILKFYGKNHETQENFKW